MLSIWVRWFPRRAYCMKRKTEPGYTLWKSTDSYTRTCTRCSCWWATTIALSWQWSSQAGGWLVTRKLVRAHTPRFLYLVCSVWWIIWMRWLPKRSVLLVVRCTRIGVTSLMCCNNLIDGPESMRACKSVALFEYQKKQQLHNLSVVSVVLPGSAGSIVFLRDYAGLLARGSDASTHIPQTARSLPCARRCWSAAGHFECKLGRRPSGWERECTATVWPRR